MQRHLLKRLRIDKSLTQAQLASKLDLSTVYVRKLEKGDVNPGRETLLKYEDFFNKDMRELFPDLFNKYNDKKLIKNEQEVS